MSEEISFLAKDFSLLVISTTRVVASLSFAILFKTSSVGKVGSFPAIRAKLSQWILTIDRGFERSWDIWLIVCPIR